MTYARRLSGPLHDSTLPIARSTTEVVVRLAQLGLIMSNGRAAYNGFRLAHEDECYDGGYGPYESVSDLWDSQDEKAWDNAAAWAIHEARSKSDRQVVEALGAYADMLQDLEMRGVLEINMPIADSVFTSYSQKILALQATFNV